MSNEVAIEINPGRVLFGLSRIGYTPASAICDIIDNSVMAGAKNIHVLINKENSKYTDSRRGNVRDYYIVDDGVGMTEETILNALQLGSSEESYSNNSLSKFGLGLKSATFSQGNQLEIISSVDSNFVKYVVSLPAIRRAKAYFATKEELNSEDQDLVNRYLVEGHGTIVKIADVRKEGHPSIKHTVDELEKKIGVIYYYFMIEDNLRVFIGDSELQAIDVLFTAEADGNGNLDENEWSGRDVRWIEKPVEITLDSESDVKAVIEITQMPHPPTFRNDERGGDAKIREKYFIDAGNYGYYVYRNKRLISWAEHFNGIIPYDQDFYSFRGRILVTDTADDAFNIDVKKSTLTLSDEAWNVISDQSLEYKRKSRKAWERASNLMKEKRNEETNQVSNSIAWDFEVPESLPGATMVPDSLNAEIEDAIVNASKNRIKKAKDNLREQKREFDGVGDSQHGEEIELEQEALKGDLNPYAKAIFRVTYTEENTLWEPYYDADHGHCVRINKNHRFAKVLFEDNQMNSDLQVLFELFLHQLAVSEVESLKFLKADFQRFEIKDLQSILGEFRRYTSEYLASLCRKLEDRLPPLSK